MLLSRTVKLASGQRLPRTSATTRCASFASAHQVRSDYHQASHPAGRAVAESILD
jgi:hypothetical protein